MQCVGGPNDGEIKEVERWALSVLVLELPRMCAVPSYDAPIIPLSELTVKMSVYAVRAGSLHYVGPR